MCALVELLVPVLVIALGDGTMTGLPRLDSADVPVPSRFSCDISPPGDHGSRCIERERALAGLIAYPSPPFPA